MAVIFNKDNKIASTNTVEALVNLIKQGGGGGAGEIIDLGKWYWRPGKDHNRPLLYIDGTSLFERAQNGELAAGIPKIDQHVKDGSIGKCTITAQYATDDSGEGSIEWTDPVALQYLGEGSKPNSHKFILNPSSLSTTYWVVEFYTISESESDDVRLFMSITLEGKIDTSTARFAINSGTIFTSYSDVQTYLDSVDVTPLTEANNEFSSYIEFYPNCIDDVDIVAKAEDSYDGGHVLATLKFNGGMNQHGVYAFTWLNGGTLKAIHGVFDHR